MQIFGQNASILPKLHYTIGYKSQKYTLFPIFHTKINALMIFCKNRLFSKKTRCSRAHILSEKRTFSLKHCALMSFFQFFNEKPPAAMSIFGRKKHKCCTNNIVWIMGQKSQWDAFFFRFFMKKSLFLYPYFVNITIRCQK